MNGLCVNSCNVIVVLVGRLCISGCWLCIISVSGLLNNWCDINGVGSVCLWISLIFSLLVISVLICWRVFILCSFNCICGNCWW